MRYSTINLTILCAFVFWFGSYAYQYFLELSGFAPLYSYFVLLGYTVVWLLGARTLRSLRDSGVQATLGWLCVYLVYGCLALINSSQDEIAVQAYISLGEATLLAGSLTVLFAESARLQPVEAVFGALAVLAALINVYDFLQPVFSNVPGRAAGLYVNPNLAGHFIAMAMVAGLSTVPRRARVLFVLVCGLGVLLTFSRASWILWGLGVVWLSWQGYIGSPRNRVIALMMGAIIGIGFIWLVFAGTLGDYLAGSSIASHLDANTLSRLGVGASSFSGYSADERQALVWDSLRIGAAAPLFGHGLGYTQEWQFPVGPHDMYLLFWVEGGLPGLLLYVSLMVLLWRKSSGTGRIIALQFIVAGVFTHNQMNQPVFLMMMAFAIAHQAVTRRNQAACLRKQGPAPA